MSSEPRPNDDPNKAKTIQSDGLGGQSSDLSASSSVSPTDFFPKDFFSTSYTNFGYDHDLFSHSLYDKSSLDVTKTHALSHSLSPGAQRVTSYTSHDSLLPSVSPTMPNLFQNSAMYDTSSTLPSFASFLDGPSSPLRPHPQLSQSSLSPAASGLGMGVGVGVGMAMGINMDVSTSSSMHASIPASNDAAHGRMGTGASVGFPADTYAHGPMGCDASVGNNGFQDNGAGVGGLAGSGRGARGVGGMGMGGYGYGYYQSPMYAHSNAAVHAGVYPSSLGYAPTHHGHHAFAHNHGYGHGAVPQANVSVSLIGSNLNGAHPGDNLNMFGFAQASYAPYGVPHHHANGASGISTGSSSDTGAAVSLTTSLSTSTSTSTSAAISPASPSRRTPAASPMADAASPCSSPASPSATATSTTASVSASTATAEAAAPAPATTSATDATSFCSSSSSSSAGHSALAPSSPLCPLPTSHALPVAHAAASTHLAQLAHGHMAPHPHHQHLHSLPYSYQHAYPTQHPPPHVGAIAGNISTSLASVQQPLSSAPMSMSGATPALARLPSVWPWPSQLQSPLAATQPPLLALQSSVGVSQGSMPHSAQAPASPPLGPSPLSSTPTHPHSHQQRQQPPYSHQQQQQEPYPPSSAHSSTHAQLDAHGDRRASTGARRDATASYAAVASAPVSAHASTSVSTFSPVAPPSASPLAPVLSQSPSLHSSHSTSANDATGHRSGSLAHAPATTPTTTPTTSGNGNVGVGVGGRRASKADSFCSTSSLTSPTSLPPSFSASASAAVPSRSPLPTSYAAVARAPPVSPPNPSARAAAPRTYAVSATRAADRSTSTAATAIPPAVDKDKADRSAWEHSERALRDAQARDARAPAWPRTAAMVTTATTAAAVPATTRAGAGSGAGASTGVVGARRARAQGKPGTDATTTSTTTAGAAEASSPAPVVAAPVFADATSALPTSAPLPPLPPLPPPPFPTLISTVSVAALALALRSLTHKLGLNEDVLAAVCVRTRLTDALTLAQSFPLSCASSSQLPAIDSVPGSPLPSIELPASCAAPPQLSLPPVAALPALLPSFLEDSHALTVLVCRLQELERTHRQAVEAHWQRMHAPAHEGAVHSSPSSSPSYVHSTCSCCGWPVHPMRGLDLAAEARLVMAELLTDRRTTVCAYAETLDKYGSVLADAGQPLLEAVELISTFTGCHDNSSSVGGADEACDDEDGSRLLPQWVRVDDWCAAIVADGDGNGSIAGLGARVARRHRVYSTEDGLLLRVHAHAPGHETSAQPAGAATAGISSAGTGLRGAGADTGAGEKVREVRDGDADREKRGKAREKKDKQGKPSSCTSAFTSASASASASSATTTATHSPHIQDTLHVSRCAPPALPLRDSTKDRARGKGKEEDRVRLQGERVGRLSRTNTSTSTASSHSAGGSTITATASTVSVSVGVSAAVDGLARGVKSSSSAVGAAPAAGQVPTPPVATTSSHAGTHPVTLPASTAATSSFTMSEPKSRRERKRERMKQAQQQQPPSPASTDTILDSSSLASTSDADEAASGTLTDVLTSSTLPPVRVVRVLSQLPLPGTVTTALIAMVRVLYFAAQSIVHIHSAALHNAFTHTYVSMLLFVLCLVPLYLSLAMQSIQDTTSVQRALALTKYIASSHVLSWLGLSVIADAIIVEPLPGARLPLNYPFAFPPNSSLTIAQPEVEALAGILLPSLATLPAREDMRMEGLDYTPPSPSSALSTLSSATCPAAATASAASDCARTNATRDALAYSFLLPPFPTDKTATSRPLPLSAISYDTYSQALLAIQHSSDPVLREIATMDAAADTLGVHRPSREPYLQYNSVPAFMSAFDGDVGRAAITSDHAAAPSASTPASQASAENTFAWGSPFAFFTSLFTSTAPITPLTALPTLPVTLLHPLHTLCDASSWLPSCPALIAQEEARNVRNHIRQQLHQRVQQTDTSPITVHTHPPRNNIPKATTATTTAGSGIAAPAPAPQTLALDRSLLTAWRMSRWAEEFSELVTTLADHIDALYSEQPNTVTEDGVVVPPFFTVPQSLVDELSAQMDEHPDAEVAAAMGVDVTTVMKIRAAARRAWVIMEAATAQFRCVGSSTGPSDLSPSLLVTNDEDYALHSEADMLDDDNSLASFLLPTVIAGISRIEQLRTAFGSTPTDEATFTAATVAEKACSAAPDAVGAEPAAVFPDTRDEDDEVVEREKCDIRVELVPTHPAARDVVAKVVLQMLSVTGRLVSSGALTAADARDHLRHAFETLQPHVRAATLAARAAAHIPAAEVSLSGGDAPATPAAAAGSPPSAPTCSRSVDASPPSPSPDTLPGAVDRQLLLYAARTPFNDAAGRVGGLIPPQLDYLVEHEEIAMLQTAARNACLSFMMDLEHRAYTLTTDDLYAPTHLLPQPRDMSPRESGVVMMVRVRALLTHLGVGLSSPIYRAVLYPFMQTFYALELDPLHPHFHHDIYTPRDPATQTFVVTPVVEEGHTSFRIPGDESPANMSFDEACARGLSSGRRAMLLLGVADDVLIQRGHNLSFVTLLRRGATVALDHDTFMHTLLLAASPARIATRRRTSSDPVDSDALVLQLAVALAMESTIAVPERSVLAVTPPAPALPPCATEPAHSSGHSAAMAANLTLTSSSVSASAVATNTTQSVCDGAYARLLSLIDRIQDAMVAAAPEDMFAALQQAQDALSLFCCGRECDGYVVRDEHVPLPVRDHMHARTQEPHPTPAGATRIDGKGTTRSENALSPHIPLLFSSRALQAALDAEQLPPALAEGYVMRTLAPAEHVRVGTALLLRAVPCFLKQITHDLNKLVSRHAAARSIPPPTSPPSSSSSSPTLPPSAPDTEVRAQSPSSSASSLPFRTDIWCAMGLELRLFVRSFTRVLALANHDLYSGIRRRALLDRMRGVQSPFSAAPGASTPVHSRSVVAYAPPLPFLRFDASSEGFDADPSSSSLILAPISSLVSAPLRSVWCIGVRAHESPLLTSLCGHADVVNVYSHEARPLAFAHTVALRPDDFPVSHSSSSSSSSSSAGILTGRSRRNATSSAAPAPTPVSMPTLSLASLPPPNANAAQSLLQLVANKLTSSSAILSDVFSFRWLADLSTIASLIPNHQVRVRITRPAHPWLSYAPATPTPVNVTVLSLATQPHSMHEDAAISTYLSTFAANVTTLEQASSRSLLASNVDVLSTMWLALWRIATAPLSILSALIDAAEQLLASLAASSTTSASIATALPTAPPSAEDATAVSQSSDVLDTATRVPTSISLGPDTTSASAAAPSATTHTPATSAAAASATSASPAYTYCAHQDVLIDVSLPSSSSSPVPYSASSSSGNTTLIIPQRPYAFFLHRHTNPADASTHAATVGSQAAPHTCGVFPSVPMVNTYPTAPSYFSDPTPMHPPHTPHTPILLPHFFTDSAATHVPPPHTLVHSLAQRMRQALPDAPQHIRAKLLSAWTPSPSSYLSPPPAPSSFCATSPCSAGARAQTAADTDWQRQSSFSTIRLHAPIRALVSDASLPIKDLNAAGTFASLNDLHSILVDRAAHLMVTSAHAPAHEPVLASMYVAIGDAHVDAAGGFVVVHTHFVTNGNDPLCTRVRAISTRVAVAAAAKARDLAPGASVSPIMEQIFTDDHGVCHAPPFSPNPTRSLSHTHLYCIDSLRSHARKGVRHGVTKSASLEDMDRACWEAYIPGRTNAISPASAAPPAASGNLTSTSASVSKPVDSACIFFVSYRIDFAYLASTPSTFSTAPLSYASFYSTIAPSATSPTSSALSSHPRQYTFVHLLPYHVHCALTTQTAAVQCRARLVAHHATLAHAPERVQWRECALQQHRLSLAPAALVPAAPTSTPAGAHVEEVPASDSVCVADFERHMRELRKRASDAPPTAEDIRMAVEIFQESYKPGRPLNTEEVSIAVGTYQAAMRILRTLDNYSTSSNSSDSSDSSTSAEPSRASLSSPLPTASAFSPPTHSAASTAPAHRDNTLMIAPPVTTAAALSLILPSPFVDLPALPPTPASSSAATLALLKPALAMLFTSPPTLFTWTMPWPLSLILHVYLLFTLCIDPLARSLFTYTPASHSHSSGSGAHGNTHAASRGTPLLLRVRALRSPSLYTLISAWSFVCAHGLAPPAHPSLLTNARHTLCANLHRIASALYQLCASDGSLPNALSPTTVALCTRVLAPVSPAQTAATIASSLSCPCGIHVHIDTAAHILPIHPSSSSATRKLTAQRPSSFRSMRQTLFTVLVLSLDLKIALSLLAGLLVDWLALHVSARVAVFLMSLGLFFVLRSRDHARVQHVLSHGYTHAPHASYAHTQHHATHAGVTYPLALCTCGGRVVAEAESPASHSPLSSACSHTAPAGGGGVGVGVDGVGANGQAPLCVCGSESAHPSRSLLLLITVYFLLPFAFATANKAASAYITILIALLALPHVPHVQYAHLRYYLKLIKREMKKIRKNKERKEKKN